MWLDEEQISAGAPFLAHIQLALQDCSGAVFVVSPEWLKSDWTAYELNVFARVDPTRPRVAILRFRRDEHQLPPRLDALHNIEWLPDSDGDACFWQLVMRPEGRATWSWE